MSRASPARDWGGREIPSAGTWRIDTRGSELAFVGRYLRVARLRMRFHRFSGSIAVADRPEDSRLEVAVEAASIRTGIPVLDRILVAPRLLHVERYPEVRFRGTGMEVLEGSRFRLTGDLTVRDVTRPVDLEVEYGGVDARSGRARFRARGVIDREEFLTWKELLGIRGWLIGRRVDLEVAVEAVRV